MIFFTSLLLSLNLHANPACTQKPVALTCSDSQSILQKLNPFSEICQNQNAKKTLVYLHGWIDPQNQNYVQFEKKNREILQQVMRECPFNLVQPVSNQTCTSQNSTFFCWNKPNPNETLQNIWNSIKCLTPKKSETILVGFSDGGYFLDNLSENAISAFQKVYITGSRAQPKNKLIQSVPQSKEGHFLDSDQIRKIVCQ